MKALKMTPIVALLKPYSLLMSVAVLARLTRSRYVMRYIKQRRSSTTQRTWLRPDIVQLLHFHSSITPRKIKPERFALDCSRSDIHRALSGSNLFSAATTCHASAGESEYRAASTPTMSTVQISSPLPLSSHGEAR